MRISDWSSDVCSSDLSTTPWPWKVRRHPPAERAGRSGDAPPFPPVPTGNRKIRPEAPPPSLQEGRFPSLRTARKGRKRRRFRSEEHTSELQSLMRNSYAVFCLKKKKKKLHKLTNQQTNNTR